MDDNVIQELYLGRVFRNPQIGGLLVGREYKTCWQDLFEETKRGEIWVTDDETKGCSVFVTDTNGIDKNKLLDVTQVVGNTLLLWHIDGAMFQKRSKGDCALIQNKYLHLIEFKANVTSSLETTIVGHYEKASEQIMKTYEIIRKLYEDVGLNIENVFVNIDAMIVFNPTIPRKNSTQQSFQEKFLREHRMILCMGNKLELD